MNSEELELSLRTEFESYLKGVFADLQQDVADFQRNFEAEFDKHKAQMDESLRNLSARFQSDAKFDKAFTESVIEHLRLARDDGASLTAHAFSEAQKLDSATPSGSYDRLRDAINDISGQATQASILKSLVDQVSNFTPRGAFFIVKHDSFVCWRKFDHGVHADDDSVRSIHFPLSADTVLADSVRALSTRDNSRGGYPEDASYFQALAFGEAEKMYAIPLVARGRGVAVLYAEQPAGGELVNLEAIESLVRVAGLTVELRAASVPAPTRAHEAPTYVPMQQAEPVADSEPEANEERTEAEADSYPTAAEDTIEEYTGAVSYEEQSEPEPEYATSDAVEDVVTKDVPYADPVVESPAYEVETEEPDTAEIVNDFAFASNDSYDASAEVEPEPVEEYAYAGESSNGSNGNSYAAVPDPVVEVASVESNKSRFSDRNVDLPIEVADDERRFHNDARRFARLLVSEIKLYNEEKVTEGRDSSDLYDRLREAIDRSREMYDKRVKPQVAAKFDYFHYELVSNLAQGNDSKLGGSYPGATV